MVWTTERRAMTFFIARLSAEIEPNDLLSLSACVILTDGTYGTHRTSGTHEIHTKQMSLSRPIWPWSLGSD